MKFCFLDFDGVLNSDAYVLSDAFRAECKSVGITTNGYEVMEKAHYLHIDPAAVKLLNTLVEKSKAKVVISSNWRNKYSLFKLNAMLELRGATFKAIDVTPRKFSWRAREHDIIQYFSELDRQPKHTLHDFVILDDINEFSKLLDNFVEVSDKVGLTQENVDQALKILGV